jgi:hypothetical protein
MALKQVTVVPTTSITGPNVSSTFQLSTATMMQAIVVLGTGSGTITDLDVWLEACNDATDGVSGTNFCRVLADLIDANGTDVATPRSNIVNNKASTTAETYGAQYKHLPAGTYRFRWNLAGTTPSIPLTIQIGAK